MEVSQLQRVPLFSDVPEDALKKIAPFTSVDEFAPGVTFIREGGYANDFFVIEEGKATVEREGQKIADLGPGDVVGEGALLEKAPRSASVTAAETVRVIKIEHWEVSRLKKSAPEVIDRLRQLVEERQSG